MKQKEKEVLLKTFCSLWLYNGYFSHCNKIHRLKTIELDGKDIINNKYPVEICYPYLRLMSSMTKEERSEYLSIKMQETERVALAEVYRPEAISEIMDWLDKHYFDYRGLIEKGLAIEAPKGMYNLQFI